LSKEFLDHPPQRRGWQKEWVDPEGIVAVGLALKKDEVKKDAELENIKNIIMLYMNAKK
jgi:hypothetical protein